MKKILIALSSVVLLTQTSCETSEKTPELVIPTVYDASQFEVNSAVQRSVLTNLATLTSEMQKGRTGGKIDVGVLNSNYAVVKTQTTSYYDNFLTPVMAEIVQVSGGQRFNPNGSQGGVYGAYLFNRYGLENEQLIEKGLFGAALYNHALSLTQSMDATTADKLLAILGANPSFASSNNASKHTTPDRFMATYVARRDKNDGNGFYSEIKTNFIKLQAALQGGTAYTNERDEAIAAIFDNWEKANAATTVNYLHSVIGSLSSTTLNETTVSSAMHSFSEAVGFLHGFKTIQKKRISDAQIDEILTLMNVTPGQTPTTLNILSSPATELPKLQQAITRLKDIYGFSDQQIEDFRKNWISEQGR